MKKKATILYYSSKKPSIDYNLIKYASILPPIDKLIESLLSEEPTRQITLQDKSRSNFFSKKQRPKVPQNEHVNHFGLKTGKKVLVKDLQIYKKALPLHPQSREMRMIKK